MCLPTLCFYGNESSKCMFVQIFEGDICFLEFFFNYLGGRSKTAGSRMRMGF